MAHKSSEKSEMSEVAFAAHAMQHRIAPPNSDQLVEQRIKKAARSLGWSFSRARDVWYADPRVSIKPRELREVEQASGLTYGRRELAEVDALISRAEAFMEGQDPDFASAAVAAFRAFLGALARPGTSR